MENSFVLRGGEPQEKPARNATEGERERESPASKEKFNPWSWICSSALSYNIFETDVCVKAFLQKERAKKRRGETQSRLHSEVHLKAGLNYRRRSWNTEAILKHGIGTGGQTAHDYKVHPACSLSETHTHTHKRLTLLAMLRKRFSRQLKQQRQCHDIIVKWCIRLNFKGSSPKNEMIVVLILFQTRINFFLLERRMRNVDINVKL